MFEPLFEEGGLSLERLRSFLAVVDAGGIARAAPGNPTRQSQLSRQIGELESFFGYALVERRVPTERGLRLAEHARWMLTGLEDLKTGRGSAGPQPLRLAAGDSVLHWLVLPRAGALGVPLGVIALPVEEVLARLHDGRIDVGVVRRDELDPRLESKPIGGIDYALFVPKALVPRNTREEDLLFRLPLALQVSEPEFLVRLRELAARRKETLDVALACETFPQVLRAVQSGRFIGVLPTLARHELHGSRFREVTSGIGKHASRLHLAWSPKLARVRPNARALVERLAAAFSP